ncbi:biotin transporter BioY [Actinomarinicola tropica]|uniref:Biotin transporter n=1 Tax=Actinomarinicola tropica TaxID=2789776 RepID=A0A5Q2RAT7_9ACTN|nr:biotin transporter BioY [Actinomarinicola tropica]QGG93979.1 biotin transporter BioY [Actinomarinicola tropica]
MHATVAPTATLADLLPATRLRAVSLVVGAAALTAIGAQISVQIPGTPVPVTLQTFAVLLAGAALGTKLGVASQVLYLAVGAAGAPIYADGEGGWAAATGGTAGYLVGFVVAAAVVGWLAERGHDRRVLTSVPAMLAGSAIIYALGVSWLAHSYDMSASAAIDAGLTPFLGGDLVKLAAAGLLLPGAWALARRD